MGYQIAGRLNPRKDLTKVAGESQFASAIRELFGRIRPRRVIETGTYYGNGSTAVIASALRELGGDDAAFYSIEVNPIFCERARGNLLRQGLNVQVLNGLSVPRAMLPTLQHIQSQFVEQTEDEDLFIDHEEADRAARYFAETHYPDAEEDLLGTCLKEFDHRPDFLLLDSGGHMGSVEFGYILPRLQGPCHIALDDIYHVKHHDSFRRVQADARFELIAVSEEKFGFCIARFTPDRSEA